MGERSRLAVWGSRIGIAALVLLVLAVAANRLGIAGYQIPLLAIALAGLAGLVAIIVSFAGIVATTRGKSGMGAALTGLVVGVIALAPVASTLALGRGVPRIHDITTDLANPPQFDTVVALRDGAPNALDRASPPDLAEQQKAAYPDLATLVIAEQPGKVFEAALDAAKEMGWAVDASAPEKGLIEATATTKLIGFKDDIAIRIVEKDGGAAVDVRSVSRVGMSDLGANAARIKCFLAALKARLAAPTSY